MTKQIYLSLLVFAFLFFPFTFSLAEPNDGSSNSKNSTTDIDKRLTSLEGTVGQLESEVDILKAESRLIIQRTSLGYLDKTYLKGGFSLILPRRTTFSYGTDTGLGAWIGAGHYLGRNHVLDLSFDWDVYPSLTFRYRLEFHPDTLAIAWGPVIGYKVKLINAKPWDNFLDSPSDVNPSFLLIGGMLGFPMMRGLFIIEVNYLINQQALLFVNAGVQFFL